MMVAGTTERVDIEEPIAAQRNAGDQAVIDLALQDVGILAVAAQQKHPVVPHRHADGGTGLGIVLSLGRS